MHFIKDYHPVRHDAKNSASLDMPEVGSSETSVKIYQTTRRHIPEDFIAIALRNSGIILFVILSCQVWSPESKTPCGVLGRNSHFAPKFCLRL